MTESGMGSIRIQKEKFKGNKTEGFHPIDAIHSNSTEFPFYFYEEKEREIYEYGSVWQIR